MTSRPENISRLVSQYDQGLAAAVDWWRSASSDDRRNLLQLLCNERMPIAAYRGLNDAALGILRDLAALAIGNIVISSEGAEEEI